MDLTTGRAESQDTSDYVPDYVGGRGIATRIAWDEIRPGVGAFDPDNLLMVFTGPLTATPAPFCGRTTVCSLGPQGYPVEWFTRSGMGGHCGPELKRAGFDGLVIRGRSERPVYLWIRDGGAEVRDAAHLWGLGTYAAQRQLRSELGGHARTMAIGQAGENLSRIAVINSDTESAAGQGGFGAVMGSKRLKAIAIHGQGRVEVAHPEEFAAVCDAVAAECRASLGQGRVDEERRTKYGGRLHACTEQCVRPCARYYARVPGTVYKGTTHAGQIQCIADHLFPGPADGSFPAGGDASFYRWRLGFEAGFEASMLANDYGINHWDILMGIVPWLIHCADEGELRELDGRPIDFDDPGFWAELMRKIAYREGVGDVLAEGGWRASRQLAVGKQFAEELYPAWGQAGHWDGHGDHLCHVVFPYWLVSALQWAVDTRDPISSAHGYAQNLMGVSPFSGRPTALTWEQIRAIGERLYSTAQAVDPLSEYEGKAVAAIWHGHRSILKDSLTADDIVFPRIYSQTTPDGFARAEGPNGLVMDGPSFEYHLFRAATGAEWDEADLDQAAERIANLDRAHHVRNRGRTRRDDESIIPNLERPENWVNPLLGERRALDRERFRKTLDEYYELRGWDVETGWPTWGKLTELGLPTAAAELYPSASTGDARPDG